MCVLLNYFSITADIPSDRYHIPIVYATDDQYVMPTIVSMESAVRSAYKFITGRDMKPIELKVVRGTKEGIKKATVDINGRKINIVVAQGGKNAMDLLAKIEAKEPGFEDIHFLEVMACPGGCVVGGGSHV